MSSSQQLAHDHNPWHQPQEGPLPAPHHEPEQKDLHPGPIMTVVANWLLGSMGGMITATELCLFCFGTIAILPAERTGARSQGSREVIRGENVKLGLGNQNYTSA
jgi:hypothetical protein